MGLNCERRTKDVEATVFLNLRRNFKLVMLFRNDPAGSTMAIVGLNFQNDGIRDDHGGARRTQIQNNKFKKGDTACSVRIQTREE